MFFPVGPLHRDFQPRPRGSSPAPRTRRICTFISAACAVFAAATSAAPLGSTSIDDSYAVVHAFKPKEGQYPIGGLVVGPDGALYGVAIQGGVFDPDLAYWSGGTVFRVQPDGTTTVIHAFRGFDGEHPQGKLIIARDGKLYGTTNFWEGATGSSNGTIFRLNLDGTQFEKMVTFPYAKANITAGLVQASDGNFYGTSATGGATGDGFIYRMTQEGRVSVIHQFDRPQGANPGSGSLMQAADGKLYGTTLFGGSGGAGTIFRISLHGTHELLHSFVRGEGGQPDAPLVQGVDGGFYGTTTLGLDGFAGSVVFVWRQDSGFQVLHDFASDLRNGYLSGGGLIQIPGGDFLGTNQAGASRANSGAVYRMTPQGETTNVHRFGRVSGDGKTPFQMQLALSPDGQVYGVTRYGGSGNGVVFRVEPSTGTASAPIGESPRRGAR